MSIDKEFVPHQESLELKELGFDEPCFALLFTENKQLIQQIFNDTRPYDKDIFIQAPTFSQAFRFFREKYKLHQYIKQYYGEHFYFHIEDMVHPRRWDEYTVEMLRAFNESSSQEEAELACLRKLIEIVKQKS